MGEISETGSRLSKPTEEVFVVVNIKEGGDQVIQPEEDNNSHVSASTIKRKRLICCPIPVTLLQKLLAEMLGVYFLVFAGCASIVVNKIKDGQMSHLGISMVWGLAVMTMAYSVGHISGCHINPAVSITFATLGRFPWRQVPAYAAAQLLGSILATITLRLLFGTEEYLFFGNSPSGSDMQSLVMEFIVSFYLMFVICGVTTDNQTIGPLGKLVIGAVIIVNVLFDGFTSGSAMNPARSLGPAIVWNRYKSVWVYVVGPICGMICGAWTYNLIRLTNKSSRKTKKCRSSSKIVASLQKIAKAKRKSKRVSYVDL